MNREEIEKHTIAFLRTAGGTRPDLRVVEAGGRRVVVKDFRRSDPLFRLLIGPILIRRERGALKKLSDVEGVPHLVESINRYAIVIEHIDGKSLRDSCGPVPEGFFDRLAEVVRAVHERGVTHCDLRSSGNVIVANDGSPYIVDFAACVLQGRGWNPFINFLFRQFAAADDHAVLILKRKHAPEALRPEDVEQLATPIPYEQFARSFGIAVRNLTRRLLTRARPDKG
ncbi:MAG: hypothetical protein HYX78_13210 [Armatimonadetes bacterium]|nr:hypothetical protein [Armatimonadota bacterium]